MGKKKSSMPKESTEMDMHDMNDDSKAKLESNDDTSQRGSFGKKLIYDANFSGPIENRKVRDVFFLIIFFLFIFGMIAVTMYAVVNGNPQRLINSVDSAGRICGYNNVNIGADYTNRTKLLYLDITKCAKPSVVLGCSSAQVCVEKCPTRTFIPTRAEEMVCVDGYTFNSESDLFLKNYIDAVMNGSCAPYFIESKSILNRCIPFPNKVVGILNDSRLNNTGTNVTEDNVSKAINALSSFLDLTSTGEKFVHDLGETWMWLVGIAAISMVISLCYIFVMQCVVAPFVWATILLSLSLMIGVTVLLFYEWHRVSNIKDPDDKITMFLNNLSLGEYAIKIRLSAAIIMAVITFVLIVVVIFLRKRIKLAIRIIVQASKALRSVFYVVLFPVISWIAVVLIFAGWGVTAIYLATSGEERFENDGVPCNASTACIKNGTFVGFESADNLVYLQVYNLFGLFWGVNFIFGVEQCTLAGVFASWYWCRDRKKWRSPLFKSFVRTLFYHAGSIALGSLLIALVQIIRVMLEALDRSLKKRKETKIAKFFLCILKCCFWCLEKLIRFITRNAYIEIAVYGYSFCTAARKVFFLLARNIIRVVAVDKVSDLVFLLGKLGISFGIGAASYYFFKDRQDELNYYMVPVVISACLAFAIATIFLSVFEMAIDTIFIAFLEDSERNDGSEEKPYFMSKSLQRLL